MPNRQIGNATRVQNTTDETTVKSSAGVLQRVILSNGGGSARTLTIKDGATTLNVLNIAANASAFFDFGVRFATSLKVTASHADVDALIVYA